MTLPALYRPIPTNSLTDLYVTLDGWSAPAVDAAGTEWWASTIDGWSSSPGVRLSGVDRPQDHGGFDGPSYYGSRIVTIAGTAIAVDRTTALLSRDIVASLCPDPSQLYTLQVTEPVRGTRRASVRLNAETKVSDVNEVSFDWQIQLKCPDPRRYDDVESVEPLLPPTGAIGGMLFPVTFPVVFAVVAGSTSSVTAWNAGTAPTRPVVTLQGPLVDPQLGNITASRTLSFSITLVAGDTLVVDFDRRTVVLNGTASRSSTLTASAAWWELAPGGNDLMFTAGGGTGSATVRWRSAWW